MVVLKAETTVGRKAADSVDWLAVSKGKKKAAQTDIWMVERKVVVTAADLAGWKADEMAVSMVASLVERLAVYLVAYSAGEMVVMKVVRTAD